MAGCTNKPARQMLVDFINDPDNKITQSIQVGNVKVITKLLPYDYRNMLEKTEDSAAEDHYTYFSVKIEGLKEKPVKDKLLYLNFDMQTDFIMLQGQDSIAPVICQRIENGRSGSYEYLVAFDNDYSPGDFTLFYKDKIFGIGTVAFVYKEKDLSKIPSLKTLVSNEAYR
jgi:hypothetical protein